MSLYFVAAEASGDLLAREVAEAVRRRRPDIAMDGIGGAELASIGIQSPIDISPLSVLGFVEGIKAYGTVVRLADEAADDICRKRPKVVVLVDSWGFMLRVAQRVRARDPAIRLVKLIGPQVWATRPGRAKTLAASVDHLLCMHDIEVPFYEPFGLKVTVIGNPALARGEAGDGASFRRAHGIEPDVPVVLVLPGSRRSEITLVAPALMSAARQIKAQCPASRIVVQPASSILTEFRSAFPDTEAWAELSTNPGERYDAMAGSTIALACSGTVTSEVAMQGTPMIVGYKTGWITWALARGLLYKRVHISLLNILNGDVGIVPEYVQTRLDAALIAGKAMSWIDHPEELEAQRQRQNEALKALVREGQPAAEIAAGAIITELEPPSGA
ncbi:MAG: lipid-A-disaccharide synthase [Hyphomonas sp.]|uniref:lipid-A-disaccharide synthase n=1 Tax=Hyphomonas sp. TaxID=87 RepID=UPI00180A6DD3|nr:lipid-A-disaccharide synthase [Hyphomonas sp.]MBA3069676.1 lipid-A-disaccharide synthase [Hyphomonas sp.]MBU3920852.1 lipid-A-disaccharide synthase [Alphaproteobacteria bacterium]MBU4062517.1 lipid-A-disaccharide synthase [Alphaproteobacteria bacterium]MBU4163868.1 lipid-A-disaccharide synthase [Alphaproteobacteria bacterium]